MRYFSSADKLPEETTGAVITKAGAVDWQGNQKVKEEVTMFQTDDVKIKKIKELLPPVAV
ncbi:3-deoxy-7-phosphoheptulonate synthase, partial [Vibrio cholerae]|nr:3-deoxy-7-phosphoheptulonate synthase [Vibrio cholerae]